MKIDGPLDFKNAIVEMGWVYVKKATGMKTVAFQIVEMCGLFY